MQSCELTFSVRVRGNVYYSSLRRIDPDLSDDSQQQCMSSHRNWVRARSRGRASLRRTFLASACMAAVALGSDDYLQEGPAV